MIKKLYSILYLLGSLLIILGFVLFIPLIIVFIYNESIESLQAFLLPASLSIFTGIIFSKVFRRDDMKLSLTSSMMLCAFAWIMVSIVGAIPLWMSLDKSIIDCLFEAVSGFTTTGITVLQGLEFLPKSIIFWRSLMQWLGGLGILTFFLFITFRNEGNFWQLFTAESHKINMSRPVPNIYKTIKILWTIYFGFTVLNALILFILKLPLYDAVIHSLTTISTGGFSNYDISIGYYSSINHPNFKLIEYVTILFMFIGGINFLIHYKILTGNIKEFFNNTEVRYFRRIILAFVLITLLSKSSTILDSLDFFEEAVRKSLFQVMSIITTTGYTTEDIGSSFFPAIAKQLFLILMFVGGCVGSTSGGFKVVRVSILNQLFKREIKKIYLPNRSVVPVTLDKAIIDDNEIFKIAALFFAWIFLVLIGGGITAVFSDLDPFQSLSGMLSAVSNIGPFYFTVEKMASLSPIIKITYILGMIAGRLEIIPVFVLFSRKAWK